MTRPRGPRFVWIAASMTIAAPAGPLPVVRIADTNTPVPGGTGNFTAFSIPSLAGPYVAFGADGESDQQGVYLHNAGVIERIADKSTLIPGAEATFRGFGTPSVDPGGNVAFFGRGEGDQFGIYASGAGLHTIADASTIVSTPMGPQPLTDVSTRVAAVGDQVVFTAWAAYHSSVYRGDGVVVSPVADWQTPLPGATGEFIGAYNQAADGTYAAFVAATTDTEGVYVHDGDTIALVADSTTTIPGGAGVFTGFGQLAVADGDVSFLGIGSSASEHGIYARRGGVLDAVATVGDPIPGGVGAFESFLGIGGSAIDDGNVVFGGFGPDEQHGLYAHWDGSLVKILDRNDLLDGQHPLYLLVGNESLEGDQLAFTAVFQDMTFAVYVATIPEPTAACSLLLAACALRSRRAA
ncbi:MAG: hypothetical protein HRF50_03760 [Phycisphaerae bacterium]|jgi:hypothetical protein